MLNKSISEFKKIIEVKKNQILFYTIKSNGVEETENLINNFLIEKIVLYLSQLKKVK